jgi:UDP-N-acetylglucosamine 2-epimerase (non-hydrolysing)
MKRVSVLVGTRPNFIKVTRFKKVASSLPGISVELIHTGQHYDEAMADVFFRQFSLNPDVFLSVGSGSPNTQIAKIMLALEEHFLKSPPHLLVVVGDVNSTLAGALVANKMNIPLAHVESGLRSFDRAMPEEYNRVLTDKVSDYFFVTEKSGLENLEKEGVDKNRVFFVGNTMIDTMVAFEKQIEASVILEKLKLSPGSFCLMTMHRPATVDNKGGLQLLLDLIGKIQETDPVVFPIHPRTRQKLKDMGFEGALESLKGLTLTDPLDYFSFQKLVKHAGYIVTDSGGIQEESTFLRVPCLTLRPNTERPSTIEYGTNELLPFKIPGIMDRIEAIRTGKYKKGEIPPLWDGKATDRIFEVISSVLK